MSEAALWAHLRRKLRGRWDAQRHEDILARGVPDVSYGARGVQGWIELKYLDAWPARGGVVRIPHYTREQRLWLRFRGEAGGRCFLLLRVGREHLLFDWRGAQVVGEVDYGAHRRTAIRAWERGIDADELLEELTR